MSVQDDIDAYIIKNEMYLECISVLSSFGYLNNDVRSHESTN